MEKVFECVRDNEWGEHSKLVGEAKTILEWQNWAIKDRLLLKDMKNYVWFGEAKDDEVINRVSWFYNIELVEKVEENYE